MSCIGDIVPARRLVLDVDQVLLDTRPSFYEAAKRVVAEVGGVLTDEGIATFKAAGGFNDDWHMARSAAAISRWKARTGDTTPLADLIPKNVGQAGILGWADDPGDLTDRCRALYADLAANEVVWVDVALLKALQDEGVSVCFCTGRTRGQVAMALSRLGLAIDAARTMEDALKPDPMALLPLLDVESAWFVGDSVDDQNCALAARPMAPGCALRFARVVEDEPRPIPGADAVTRGVNPFLERLLEVTRA